MALQVQWRFLAPQFGPGLLRLSDRHGMAGMKDDLAGLGIVE
ncbi:MULTISPECIES: hypothetical protein [Methylobacillus]|nr:MULTISPECIES: hypothetical protein [Methylobacillus]